jgi:hypothetical protein
MRHTGDQVGVLTESLCGRHVYVDHLLGESLEHVTMRLSLNVACLLSCLARLVGWIPSCTLDPRVVGTSLHNPIPTDGSGPEVIIVQARICDSDGTSMSSPCHRAVSVESRPYLVQMMRRQGRHRPRVFI